MVDEGRQIHDAIRLKGLTGRWGNFVLHPVELDIPRGEYLVLLGPSGCGKTTLVELLCGLRYPNAGQVLVDGQDIIELDPRERRVGYVPQDYDLFPGRTVEQNVRFAAKMRGARGTQVEERFTQLIDILHIGPIVKREVDTLSGGEQQRVALARALMADPTLLLLDEPVSALPEFHRDRVCGELKRLHTELGLTTIHVSHNLEEALLVGDRMAVMDEGRIVQIDEPWAVLERPIDRFVAESCRCKNIWEGAVSGGILEMGGLSLAVDNVADGDYWVVVRPERLSLGPATDGANVVRGQVVSRSRSAHAILSCVEADGLTVWGRDDRRDTAGAAASVTIPTDHLHFIRR